MSDDPVSIEVTVTCQTEGCTNRGVAITLTVIIGTSVICGPCGADITPSGSSPGV